MKITFIGKAAFLAFIFVVCSLSVAAQKSKFTGKWEYYWDREASKGFEVVLKEKNGRVSGTANGFIPHLYEAEIKPAKIVGNSFTANIADDWGNTATVKVTIHGRKLYWRVLKSKRKGSFTFPDKLDLNKVK
ncbi:MAG TPA: hypothetical protein PKY59_21420 [Pyrinomonadaceae bacterium]|nr:hypothetical protein [Pyrinomonadaceae bacterium]